MDKRLIKRIFINPIGIFLSLVAGILIGFLFAKSSYFKFDTEVKLIEALNLIVTAGLGYIIATILSKRVAATRVEKDLLIKQISSIMVRYETIYEYVISSQIPYNNVVSQFKAISKGLSDLERFAKSCDHDISKGISDIFNKNIFIKAEVTDHPEAKLGTIYGLSSKSLIGFNTKYSDQTALFFSLIVTVNRH